MHNRRWRRRAAFRGTARVSRELKFDKIYNDKIYKMIGEILR